MIDQQIYTRLSLLDSEQLKKDLLNYLDQLLAKQSVQEKAVFERKPRFGSAKGKFHMAEDFDAPIDHFDDYMPS